LDLHDTCAIVHDECGLDAPPVGCAYEGGSSDIQPGRVFGIEKAPRYALVSRYTGGPDPEFESMGTGGNNDLLVHTGIIDIYRTIEADAE
jgi:hypothetical protein